MFTPNLSHDDPESIMPEWHEPFPEPQTIPSGWDLSELLALPAHGLVEDTAVGAED
jgi:hypothetical protein